MASPIGLAPALLGRLNLHQFTSSEDARVEINR
jgi:hypothetical protein